MRWLEEGLRVALQMDGRALLEGLLSDPGLSVPEDEPRPGEKTFQGRERTVQSLFGPLTLRRRYYYDESKAPGACGRCPLDKALGLMDDFTPALARLCARAGAQAPFGEASDDLREMAGVHVSGRQVQRLMQTLGPRLRETLKRLPREEPPPHIPIFYVIADGTGVPMAKAQLQGVKGRAPDGQAHTREAKLGCVFTQTGTDDEGWPVRDENSTSYISTFCEASVFGTQLLAEARRRGIDRAATTVVLGDGAAWIWELSRVNFEGAVEILDFYHASEHLAALARLVEAPDSEGFDLRFERWRSQIQNSQLDLILEDARKALDQGEANPGTIEEANKEMAYLEKNRARLDYASFRARGLFIGSGVVEAGCKTIVGQRLKCSGMFWGKTGAQNVLSIRCAIKSPGQFDRFWQAHAAA